LVHGSAPALRGTIDQLSIGSAKARSENTVRANAAAATICFSLRAAGAISQVMRREGNIQRAKSAEGRIETVWTGVRSIHFGASNRSTTGWMVGSEFMVLFVMSDEDWRRDGRLLRDPTSVERFHPIAPERAPPFHLGIATTPKNHPLSSTLV
jgi:hypothetical protein